MIKTKNAKRWGLILVMLLAITTLMGTSYSLLKTTNKGTNVFTMKVGTLEVLFLDDQINELTLENNKPITDETGLASDKELSFTIQNTGTLPARYSIYIEETSTNPEMKNVIRFSSSKNNSVYKTPKTLGDNNIIDTATLSPNQTITYKVKVWLSEDADISYMNKTFTARIVVDTTLNYDGFSKNFTDLIKSKLGTEGLIAVNTDGTLYDPNDNNQIIREYRFSGIGNYCTYTDGTNDYNWSVEGLICPTTFCTNTNAGGQMSIGSNEFFLSGRSCYNTMLSLKTPNSIPTDSGLRNYVLFNEDNDGIIEADELWRIIGVFGDNVKLVKDLPFIYDALQETNYLSGNITYQLKTEGTNRKYEWLKYKHLSDDTYNNDWTTSGVKSYLNDESGNSYYNSVLTTNYKNMIESSIYYLGNVTQNSENLRIEGTVSQVYNQERETTVCSSSVTTYAQNSNCNIWNGNQVSWFGKVGLLYPSDYGYAADSNNWTSDMRLYAQFGASLNNWMLNTDAWNTWFISPSSRSPEYQMMVLFSSDIFAYPVTSSASVRPTLYLKSSVITIGGDGSYKNPYRLKGLE